MYRQKQRHGFLAVYLGFLLIDGVIGTVYGLLVVLVYARKIPLHDRWTYLAAILSGALGVAFILALFRWKKWGFYGYVLLATADLGFRGTNFGSPMRGAVFTFAALVALRIALQIGGERQGWRQLEQWASGRRGAVVEGSAFHHVRARSGPQSQRRHGRDLPAFCWKIHRNHATVLIEDRVTYALSAAALLRTGRPRGRQAPNCESKNGP